MTNASARPRKTPCASCPYRRNVPSGIWDASEYDKLPGYDGETALQRTNLFLCHQATGQICSGWLAHRGDPYDLLAVRLAVMDGRADPDATLNYETDVPLFPSGAAARDHGLAELDNPSDDARHFIRKITDPRRTA